MKIRTLIAAILCFAMTWTAISAPITGSIDIDGNASLDADEVNAATQVSVWSANSTGNPTGAFTNVPNGTAVSFSPSAWLFASGSVTNFWSAGGFTFNLTSSTIAFDSGGFLNVSLTGTISGNGYDTTACVGFFGTSDSSSIGGFGFSEGMSFGAVAAPPCLTLMECGTNSLTILWPTNVSYNYTLQQNCDLSTTNWVATSFPITNGFGTNFCTVSPLTGNLFFRLSQ